MTVFRGILLEGATSYALHSSRNDAGIVGAALAVLEDVGAALAVLEDAP